MKQPLTTKTCLILPDGTEIPISTIYHVGTPEERIERHQTKESMERIKREWSTKLSTVLSEYESIHSTGKAAGQGTPNPPY